MSLPADLTLMTAAQARSLLDNREISSVELTRAYFERIEEVEPEIHSYLHVMTDVALTQASDADRRIEEGDIDLLTGVPIALKDILCTTDAPTTAASKILEGYVSPYDATVVTRLRDQGAVFLGKTNTDEFAMGSSTENSAYGETHNPWDTSRVPGGSSGGSAAAIAAREATVSLGSDTGGSVRQPAGFCGIVGLKPTYGRVSRYGLLPFASSLDQIGPFARTVEDAAIMLRAIAGKDPLDSTSVPVEVPDYLADLRQDLKGVRIGVAPQYTVSGMEPGVEAAVKVAIKQLEDLGAEIVEVSLPHTEYALATYYITAPAEASANLARYDGVRYGNRVEGDNLIDTYLKTRGRGFGPEVKRRIMLGTHALSSGYYDAYYVKAQKVRTLIKQDFDVAFESCDVVVAPTSPTIAFKSGSRTSDPYQMYLADIFTIPANMVGIPGISVPCGFSDGMPVGLQFLGKAFDESRLLGVAHAYEQAAGWYLKLPEIPAG
ncbi:MAG TPA: Asp-tRNA(Asn)/Glu-tRNA(Gln) amidotransferase subunit GatA [Thermomicrobiales bacterium]|nr:Asp-tRNA(Asn)/Glu-tRNA(Gln) amidotransferase subunit GatA [Thermomicrobiales bacterium]